MEVAMQLHDVPAAQSVLANEQRAGSAGEHDLAAGPIIVLSSAMSTFASAMKKSCAPSGQPVEKPWSLREYTTAVSSLGGKAYALSIATMYALEKQ
mmetsp:Transcript_28133/g.92233  ORF Transcript_28133/g.92233 Transcript_28133/m.92233 type:complete len:96 (-) Transcript_28133:1142-1429(-)